MRFLVLLGVSHVFAPRVGLGLDSWHVRLLGVALSSTWFCLSSRIARRGREWKRLGILNVWAQKSENVFLCILLVRTVMACVLIHRKGMQGPPVDEHRDMNTEGIAELFGVFFEDSQTPVF